MPSAIINTGTHPKLLWPGIQAIWGQVYDQHPTEYTDLFDVDSSSRAYEEDVQIVGPGLATIKPEGKPGSFLGEAQGGVTRYTHVPYSLGYIVTHEELSDNLYEEVSMRRAKANAFSMAQTVEHVAAFLYNNAHSTTYYTTWDGKAVCASDHVKVSGGTWSNTLTPSADLSEAALEDICIQMMDMTNDAGLKISVMPRSLHVATAEYFNANRILKSTLQSDTANNNINVLRVTNAFPEGIKVNHYFTVPGTWFVRTNVQNGLKFLWREKPSLQQDNDFDTKNAKALSYMRFALGVTDPMALFSSNRP